jgi:hypothetical protein
MALANLNTLKEQGATFRPTLLVTITFGTGLVLRLSTISCTYGGNAFLGRIADETIDRIQALSEQGIDRVPSLSLQIADPDAVIWTNYERVAGFKGATLEARFVFFDPFTPDFSSDSLVVFSGICNLPRFDQETISLRVQNKANLQKVLLPIFPIQRRCANINPSTVAQRTEASNEDSLYYQCGEIRDLTTAPPCAYTKGTCTQPNRFSGVTWEPPQGGRSREYTSGQWLEIKNNANEAKYGDFYPIVYGTAWVEPPVINVTGDANYTRGECVVMAGEATQILRVIVNDVELSPATDMGGTPYSFVNKDFRYHVINNGDRDGAPNLDTPYNGNGDPYGNLCAVYFVVPRRVAEASSTPSIKVLVQGAKVRVYSDPSTFTKIYSDNWAWVMADLLTRTKYTWADLNIVSFLNAAAVYGGNVTYTNQYGNASATESRGSCSIVLRQRRSLADILRGVRLASGMLLLPNADGKLSILAKGTLADQQPAAVDGSNYNTAITSKVRTGATTNGYAAYSFDGSNILRRGGKSTLVRIDREINDLPNRVAFQFSDRDYGYAPSNFAIIDSDDIARAGQEVSGGLAQEPLGLNSYNASNRMGRLILNEALRGNPLSNTNGTDYWAWETSVKGLRLQMGQIVRLTDTRAGVTNVLIRLTSIQPSRDYQTVRLEGHVHIDDWYLDSAGQAADPAAAGRRRDMLDRPAFPWRPNKTAPIASDALWGLTDLNFALQPVIEYAADGTPIVKLSVSGQLPVNEFADLRPPVINTQGTTASSGGSISGGGRVYHFAICARDGAGKLSTPSPLCFVVVTNVGNANTITIPVVAWDSAQNGYEVFGGLDPNAMCWQATGSGTGATSVTLTAIKERSFGVPDIEFDRLLVRLKRVQHSGILGTAAAAVSATTITIGGTWTSNVLAGYEVSLLGKADNSALPVANFAISANTTDGILTVSPDPTAFVAVGDAVVVRSKPSVSGAVITDANWVNHFGPSGLAVNALTGFTLRIIKGLGRGKTYTIASNTSTEITLVQAPEMDATSRYVVEESAWLPDQADSSTVDNAASSRETSFLIPTGNYQQQTLLVQAMTMDGGNNEAFESLAPVRDIYQFGAPIIESFRAVTANYTAQFLDQVLGVDTTAGGVVLSLPDPADVAGQTFLVKRKTGGSNGLSVQPLAGTIEGSSSVSLPTQYDLLELYSDGSNYLRRNGTGGGGGGAVITPWYAITYAASITPSVANGKNQRVTLTGDITVNFPTGATDGAELRLVLIQDATGGRTVTFSTGWKLDGSEVVPLASTKSTIEVCFKSSSEAESVHFTTGVTA